MTGKLTTHVLDTARGLPAANVRLELWRLDAKSKERTLVKALRTNQDGRTDQPVLDSQEMQAGFYELVFEVGDYFTQASINPPTPLFLDQVPIRFGIADPESHYHVPLLVSPWSYSTYRGS